ncbi:alkylhydroperoxidase [Niabella ginsenosidivorans]|uniref:Alkylhydroperoxidase n=1 Tax=Niabella ginsenosidivorans TaxID=1176587 RepID=A0A1A9HYL9_9BACT|nr:carboxymuconolactone decarboxylase family protein [Niabella ginsenosidivorans]ANH80343.1 alkylhydroperoxidase [Niabella ginsenosidivorans]
MRLEYSKVAPEGYKALLGMYGYLKNSNLPAGLLHMVYLKVSQINGCPYCVDLHWKDAVQAGIDGRKLNAVSNWKHMPFFTEAERAALALAEEMTVLPGQEVSDAVYEEAKRCFDDKNLVDLSLAIAHMNMLNRVAITFHKVPEK